MTIDEVYAIELPQSILRKDVGAFATKVILLIMFIVVKYFGCFNLKKDFPVL